MRPDPSSYELEGHGNEGRSTGVLLVHGFTASPTETRPFADYIYERAGWHCLGVRLAGHGTSVEDLDRTDRSDWLESARQGLERLRERGCRQFLLTGVSMGAVLCCHLAVQRLDWPIRGMVLMAPAFALPPGRATLVRAASFFKRTSVKPPDREEYYERHGLFSYLEAPLKRVSQVVRLGAQAKRTAGLLLMPVLVLAGAKDDTVSNTAIRTAAARMQRAKLVVLPRSGHILTVEPDADRMFDLSFQFLKGALKGSAPQAFSDWPSAGMLEASS